MFRADVAIKMAALYASAGRPSALKLLRKRQNLAPGFRVHTHLIHLQSPTAENFVRMGVPSLVTGTAAPPRKRAISGRIKDPCR